MGTRMEERRCAYCNGKGVTEEGELVRTRGTCPVCEGIGIVSVPVNWRKCPMCGGSGRKGIGEHFSQLERCQKCQGMGWVEPPPLKYV